MSATLTKKDYKIIWINPKDSEKVIIEIKRDTLNGIISRKIRKDSYDNISFEIEGISWGNSFLWTNLHKRWLKILSEI